MGSFIAPIAGMAKAEVRFEAAASRIAKAGISGGDAQDQVDLSAEMVAILESRNSYSANVKVAQAADEMEKSTLKILG